MSKPIEEASPESVRPTLPDPPQSPLLGWMILGIVLFVTGGFCLVFVWATGER